MSVVAAAGEDDESESCVVFECTHKSWVENIDPEKLQVLADMYDSGSCTDVVIQCTDHHLIHAHRDVLAARSQLFSLALKKSSRKCSVLEVKYLPFKYVKALVDLMYHNRVVVKRTDARSLTYLMEQFQLRGAFGEMGPYGLLARLSGAKLLGEHFDRLYEYTVATPVPKVRQPRGTQRPAAESRRTFLPRGRAKVCKPDTATNREQVKRETQSPVAESRGTFLPRGGAKVCKPDTAANQEQVKRETQSHVAESGSTFLPRGGAKVCKPDTAANHEQQTAVRREPASLGCLVQEGQLQAEQAETSPELKQSAAVHNTRSKRLKVEAEEPCHAAVATNQRAGGRKRGRKPSASASKAASAPVAVPWTPVAKRISKAKRIPAATHSISSLNGTGRSQVSTECPTACATPTQAAVPRFANVDSQGNKIPRPPNAFMIFGQDFRKLLADGERRGQQQGHLGGPGAGVGRAVGLRAGRLLPAAGDVQAGSPGPLPGVHLQPCASAPSQGSAQTNLLAGPRS
ncbi:uncharacterized protein LOC134537505 [Bacillus rossius redtenbacheri]|uniref:uncharacterized protein LOC134537505 n=1 Tax=Bacillus rossius redtenbacheri TaxID=93214 RepID=UPI002FDE2076